MRIIMYIGTVRTCVLACVYVYIRTYIHVQVRACTYVRICTGTYTYIRLSHVISVE